MVAYYAPMALEDDKVFKALADASRRKLLDRLHKTNGLTLGELCGQHDMSRQAVGKHLALLEAANLVVTVWRGREKLHYLNPVPINEIATRWIGKFDQGRLQALHNLIYTTYIKTTPEKLWAAIINPEFQRQYWFGVTHETDWKVGSPWRMVYPDGRVTDSGEVVEADPPRRLVLKWLNEWNQEMKAEGYSLCTMEIEPVTNAVKLTVKHTMERAESKLIGAVSGGWPRILSNLKSLLETGQVVLESK